jgi:hypothetical protein
MHRRKPTRKVPEARRDLPLRKVEVKEGELSNQSSRWATQQLEKFQEVADPALRKVLTSRPSLEVQQRVQRLLVKLAGVRRNPPRQRLRLLRALEVLEHIGTAAAQQVLKTLAGGAPDAQLTQEARAALNRLTRRPGGKP